MDSINVHSIFPTLYITAEWEDQKKHKQDLLDFCYKYEKTYPHKDRSIFEGQPHQEAFEGEYNYYGSLLANEPENLFEYDELKPLLTFITTKLKDVNSKMNFKEDHKWNITHSWLNINRKYSMHRAHSHGHSVWSGIYYLKTNQNSAPLVFTNALGEYRQHWPHDITPIEPCEFTSSQQIVYPQEGQLILFPGYLIHSVPQHLDDEDRVNIAFNIS